MYQFSRLEKSSSEALLPVPDTPGPASKHTRTPRKYLLLIGAAISCFLIFFSNVLPACLQSTRHQDDHTILHESTSSSRLEGFRTCSIKNFQATHFPFLDGVQPIARDEFVARRQRLAQALLSDGADAFAVEPGKLRTLRPDSGDDLLTHTFSHRLHFLILCEHHAAAMGSMGARRAPISNDHPTWSRGRSEDNVSRPKLRSRASPPAGHAVR